MQQHRSPQLPIIRDLTGSTIYHESRSNMLLGKYLLIKINIILNSFNLSFINICLNN